MRRFNLKGVRERIMNLRDFSDFYLYDFPEKVDFVLYESCLNKAVEYFSKKEGVLSLFLAGNLKGDGISDIDLLVVIDEGIDFNSDFFSTLEGAERHLFAHPVFCVDRRIFKSLKYLMPFYNLKLLFNGGFLKRDISLKFELEEFYGSIFFLKNLISFLRAFIKRRFGIRSLLLNLSGMKYDIEIFKPLFEDANTFLEKVSYTRENWFLMEDERRLKLLFDIYRDGINYSLHFFESGNLDLIKSFIREFGIKHYFNIYFNFGDRKDIKIYSGGRDIFTCYEIIFENYGFKGIKPEVKEFFRYFFDFGKRLKGDVSLPFIPIFSKSGRSFKIKLFEILNRNILRFFC